MVQPCIWLKEEPGQFSMGKIAQSITCSIMEKPHTGLDECPRILLACFRARNSGVHPSDQKSRGRFCSYEEVALTSFGGGKKAAVLSNDLVAARRSVGRHSKLTAQQPRSSEWTRARMNSRFESMKNQISAFNAAIPPIDSSHSPFMSSGSIQPCDLAPLS